MWAVKRALKPAAQFGAAAAYRQVRTEPRDSSTTRVVDPFADLSDRHVGGGRPDRPPSPTLIADEALPPLLPARQPLVGRTLDSFSRGYAKDLKFGVDSRARSCSRDATSSPTPCR